MDSVLTISITSTDTTSTQNNYFVDSTMVRVDSCERPVVTYTLVQNAAPQTWDIFPTYSLTTNATWYWGDGSSSIGMYPSHTYATAGRYNICVTVFSSCGDSVSYCQSDTVFKSSSAMVQVNVVNGSIGTHTIVKDHSLQAYPNPGNGNIRLTSDSEIGPITIYNSLGEIILKDKINSNKYLLDLTKQSPGIYFLQAQGRYIRLVKE
jgi:hypothetical protein